MTIKQFVFDVQQSLQAEYGFPIKRSQVYELIAANFGHQSYAALKSKSILLSGATWNSKLNIHAIELRAQQLNFSDVHLTQLSRKLSELIENRKITSVLFEPLFNTKSLDWAREHFHNFGVNIVDGEPLKSPENSLLLELVKGDVNSPIYIEALQHLKEYATSGNLHHHVYLYKLLEMHSSFDCTKSKHDEFLYRRKLNGDVLSGPELEVATCYETKLCCYNQWIHHLREAAKAGYTDAIYLIGQTGLDKAIYSVLPGFVRCSISIALLAEKQGLHDEAHRWWTHAALQGYIEAMHTLIKRYDSDDIYRCWVWLNLAHKCGVDITKEHDLEVYQGGDQYFDSWAKRDVVRQAGIKIATLTPEMARKARDEAQALYIKHGLDGDIDFEEFGGFGSD
ncbi:hypothetical protein K3H46_02030 [Aeromonas veronii]|uniref:hypothetical protein n=1 Tax=Aeromonas veronii TaxID=654 RepID=UPI001F15E34F|nr:hypothetical protein [Aeromonas veronii]MCF5889806.1 hypothetical protein [Aeromonas veronii]